MIWIRAATWAKARKISDWCFDGLPCLLLAGLTHISWDWLTEGPDAAIKTVTGWLMPLTWLLISAFSMQDIEERKCPRCYDTGPQASNRWNYTIGAARKTLVEALEGACFYGVMGPAFFYVLTLRQFPDNDLALWAGRALVALGVCWIPFHLRPFWPAPGARKAFKALPRRERTRILAILKKAKAQPTAMVLGLAARDYEQRRLRALEEQLSLDSQTAPAMALAKKPHRL